MKEEFGDLVHLLLIYGPILGRLVQMLVGRWDRQRSKVPQTMKEQCAASATWTSSIEVRLLVNKPLNRRPFSAILRAVAEEPGANRELALELLQRLIDLETERSSMAWILEFAKDPQTQQPVDWRSILRKDFSEGEVIRDGVLERYAQVRKSLLAAKPDCPDALSLLLSVSACRAWEQP